MSEAKVRGPEAPKSSCPSPVSCREPQGGLGRQPQPGLSELSVPSSAADERQ